MKPFTMMRNFVDRIRSMDDALHRLEAENVALRGEVAQVRTMLDASGAAVSRASHAASLAARRSTLRRTRSRVVFLVHNIHVWDSIAEIVRIMREDDAFDPIVVSIPHHYSGVGPSKGEGRVDRFLHARQVSHLRIRRTQLGSAGELLRALDPDIVFRQSQWDDDVDTPFQTDQLEWTRLVLVPYEPTNTTLNVPVGEPPVNTAVDTALHRAAWLVFLAGQDSLRLAQRDSATGGRQFRALGHPKLDALRSARPAWPIRQDDGPRRRRVLWSAHHSILHGWSDFGLFPRVREPMLEWARSEPDTEFVYMHHPLLPDTIRRPGGPLDLAEYKRWRGEWTGLDNAAYWRGEYARVLVATDVLITDSPSLMTEGQVLGVPTIFLDREDRITFNDLGEEWVKGVHPVRDVDGARRVLAELDALEHDPLAVHQERNATRFLGAPGAAARIVDAIRAEITAERAGAAG